MKTYRDPQSAICCIGSFLSNVYEDTRLQNLAVDEPKPGNLQQIHDEMLKKLECMAHAWQHDACIGGYPIPFCCETATLCKMYTMEELHVAGFITPCTNLEVSHHWTGWPAGSEFEESNITDIEAVRDTTEESTDTEMAQHAGATLMISTDREKIWLEALAKEQDWAMSRDLWEVQQCHLEDLQLMASTTRSSRPAPHRVRMMDAPATSAVVLSMRRTSKGPERSLWRLPPHHMREDTIYTASPKLISNSWHRQVNSIQVPGAHPMHGMTPFEEWNAGPMAPPVLEWHTIQTPLPIQKWDAQQTASTFQKFNAKLVLMPRLHTIYFKEMTSQLPTETHGGSAKSVPGTENSKTQVNSPTSAHYSTIQGSTV